MQVYLAGMLGAALVAAAAFSGVGFGNFHGGGEGDQGQPSLSLNWQDQVQQSKCTPPVVRHGDRHSDKNGGDPLINVTEIIKNDADSGVGGNYWAFDNFIRRIQVWQTATTTFCALVSYQGSFAAIAGQLSPAASTTLSGSEHGDIAGGYRATVTGTLLPSPLWPKKGNTGVIDYKCDVSGNCPGYVDWTLQYFAAGVQQTLDWWGWIYRGGRYGTWINAISGNLGDIHAAASQGR